LLVGLASLLTACGQDLPQDTFDPHGSVARQLDRLINPVFLIAALVFVLVEGLIVYVVIKFRRRSEDEAPRQVEGNIKAEIGWTIAPGVLLAIIGILTIGTIFDINTRPGGDALQVKVTGHQWWWEYEYKAESIVTANELHIPTGRKVDIELTSDDVIHSFWVPKLAGKLDAVPGRTNRMVIDAFEPGTYFGQCAEFCNISHANMRLTVVAHSPADFAQWVRDNTNGPAPIPSASDTSNAAAGAALFRSKGCSSCHAVEGFSAGAVGPDLTHLFQRSTFAGAIFDLNEQNLRKWLRNPPEEKPGSIMPNLNLSEDEIGKLIAYLETLN
jgi:cytochrome c oxidase subunit 2